MWITFSGAFPFHYFKVKLKLEGAGVHYFKEQKIMLFLFLYQVTQVDRAQVEYGLCIFYQPCLSCCFCF